MDLTDPQTMVTLLSSVLPKSWAETSASAMQWMFALGLLLKPLQTKIQAAVDAFNAWRHEDGNTDIDLTLDKVESKPWVRFGYWLIDWLFRIKLGTQRATTITTRTETPNP